MCVEGQRYPHPPGAGCHGNDMICNNVFRLFTVVAEPPFAYCPSSCYGNLLHGTSGEVGISIDSLFYSLIPHPHNHTYPHPHTYALHESQVPVAISWITAVNLNEACLSMCVCVYVCVCATAI